MPVALQVPSVGESISEVEIGQWLKTEGAFAAEDEPVVVIETEKATLEVPAPVSGKVTQVLKKTGERAAVGDVIGYMEEGAKPAATEKDQKPAKAEKKEQPPPPERAPQPAAKTTEMPAQPAPQTPPAPQPPPTPKIEAEPVTKTTPSVPPAGRQEDIVPMSPIRRRIADRLVEAQKNAALLTTFNEIDMSAVRDLRTAHQENFQKKHGVKLGLMSFFVKATIDALKQIPQLNAEIRGQNIAFRNYYDIGIAIGGGKGLVVPILRNAERLNFAEIEKGIMDFAERARNDQLKVDELQGGTFTISNGGVYGSLLSTPIVNPPQSGVLGLHAIEDRAVVRNGQIVARPMMYVALTYDHRIVDGREAVTFLKHIKELVEDPTRLLLDV
jgi:2-oxoglutarate dehydrogenase E2 component (dihydrolipoamide succinyltransferase)